MKKLIMLCSLLNVAYAYGYASYDLDNTISVANRIKSCLTEGVVVISKDLWSNPYDDKLLEKEVYRLLQAYPHTCHFDVVKQIIQDFIFLKQIEPSENVYIPEYEVVLPQKKVKVHVRMDMNSRIAEQQKRFNVAAQKVRQSWGIFEPNAYKGMAANLDDEVAWYIKK